MIPFYVMSSFLLLIFLLFPAFPKTLFSLFSLSLKPSFPALPSFPFSPSLPSPPTIIFQSQYFNDSLTRPLEPINYPSNFLITSVAFVPPKPKLFDITVFNSCSRISVTISRPCAASSRFSMLMLGATKLLSSISVE